MSDNKPTLPCPLADKIASYLEEDVNISPYANWTLGTKQIADIRALIEAEYGEVEKVLNEVPDLEQLSNLSIQLSKISAARNAKPFDPDYLKKNEMSDIADRLQKRMDGLWNWLREAHALSELRGDAKDNSDSVNNNQ